MAKQTDGKSTKLTKSQRLTLFFFNRPRKTALIWVVLLVFGIASYTTLLKREGFPPVNTPFAMAQGSYVVDNPQKIDSEVAKPLNDFLLKQKDVKSVQSQSYDNFYNTIVNYKEGTDAAAKSRELQAKIKDARILPTQATLQIKPFEFGFTADGDDMVVSFYADPVDTQVPYEELVSNAKVAAKLIQDQNLSLVENVHVIDPFEKAVDPLTGEEVSTQKSFDRFGERKDNQTKFYTTAVIGIKAQDGADNIKLDKQVRDAVNKVNKNPELEGFHAVVSASFAPQIKHQINELQRALLEGLIAILIVCAVVIANRASLITVLSMITVIAIVNGLMYLIGYSLNTITLFALILGLALIVDDTIIMTEAIDAQRRRLKDPTEAVSTATRKISKAMIAATSTAALSFAPLIFVGGILGSFIRAIPVTIILALIVSLLTALIFIPMFSRYLLLTKSQMGAKGEKELAAGFEAKVANFIAKPMLWAKNSRKKLVSVGLIAVVIGLGFIFSAGALFQKVSFNIFPPSKDSDIMSVTLTFPAGTDIEQAQKITDEANEIVGDTLGPSLVKASYYGQASVQQAVMQVDLTSYNDRDDTSPQLADKVKKAFDQKFNDQATVELNTSDVGPPSAAFAAQIKSDTNRNGAINLANDIAEYLKTAKLQRPDGRVVKITDAYISNTSIYDRLDKNQIVSVTAKYADTDTTTLLDLTKKAVEKEFPPSKVQTYDLPKDALGFNFGQETENQDSFKTLAIAFPLMLVLIYILLAFEFRSLLQPLLIFLAIPFSLFGITLGLYLTDNAFSFFAALGFFALVGLSIKNTILLTDYANQSRRAGMDAIDAAHAALEERFRPLVATSLTAVVALTPLALVSPFWQGLTVVLIGGLLSSTFLVLTVFPYYYLGAEFLRTRVSRLQGLVWLFLTVALLIFFAKLAPYLLLLVPFAVAVIVGKLVPKKLRRS